MWIDLPGAEVEWRPGWLPGPEAEALRLALLREVEWEVHRIRIFGREFDSPRLSRWIGDPGARYRYRFEIAPPAGTPPRECRFAIMVEGLEAAKVEGAVSFPVGGRIGVIVYAAIGDVAPALSIAGTETVQANGQPTATVRVRNTGTATGRVEGFLDATDAAGQSAEMSPADLPILPGETRRIALAPVAVDGKNAPTLRFPIKVRGQLESGKNKLPLDASFAP